MAEKRDWELGLTIGRCFVDGRFWSACYVTSLEASCTTNVEPRLELSEA